MWLNEGIYKTISKRIEKQRFFNCILDTLLVVGAIYYFEFYRRIYYRNLRNLFCHVQKIVSVGDKCL